jgi:Flp pilus assembly protein TadG
MADRVRTRRSRRDERGAVLVLVASAATALLIVTAIVVDLGLVRHERRSNQSAVDLAALAAGEALGWDPAPDGRAACASAVDYLVANVEELPTNLNVPCASLPNVCNGGTAPVTVTDVGTGGDYTIEITYPVSDSSIQDGSVAAADNLRVNDGHPCERLRVNMSTNFDSIFAPIVGRTDFDVDADSVVRQIQSSDRRVPSLWLLEPYDCGALDVTGGSSVTVGNATVPGLITVDSDATSCGGTGFSIDANGVGSSILATGPAPSDLPAQISLVAMERLQFTCGTGNLNACDPADIANGTLFPQPVRRASRATRAPVDHQYNCKTGYPDYHGLSIRDCADPTPPYIDNLVAEVGAVGTPLGFQRWTDFYGCNDPVVPVGGVTGNWHVDCGQFRLPTNSVTFAGGNVVFDGDLVLTGGSVAFNTANPNPNLAAACLAVVVGCIDESSAEAAWVVMRDGNLSVGAGSTFVARRTMIYQEDGFFEMTSGAAPVWTSPTEGPFAGLAVWTDKSSNKFKITGGAAMQLEGTFFTPEAVPMSISGGSPVIPLQAQFVSRTVQIGGGASITLSPNATLAVVLPPPPPLLIR